MEDQDLRTNLLEERGYDMNPTTMSYKHQGSKKPLMIQINPNHKDDFNKIHGLIFLLVYVLVRTFILLELYFIVFKCVSY